MRGLRRGPGLHGKIRGPDRPLGGAGAALGLSAGLSPGPLFTLVLAQSLSHGAREGVKVALAPLFTDLPILALAILAMAWIESHPLLMGLASLAGALVVARFGLDCFAVRSVQTA